MKVLLSWFKERMSEDKLSTIEKNPLHFGICISFYEEQTSGIGARGHCVVRMLFTFCF
jgi:hypothetical protein